MSRMSKLRLLTTIGAIAAGAGATGAHARQLNLPPCELSSWGSCGTYELLPQPSRHRTSDTSPTYMKQTDPRYSSAMTAAGGGGGGGGGGGR